MDINQILQQGLTDISMALLGLVFAFGLVLISKAKARLEIESLKIKDEKQRALVTSAITRINDLAINAVSMVNQTVVSDLKVAIESGVKDRSELLALGNKVATDIYTQLSPSLTATLETEINDVKSYILSVVETQVANLKPVVSASIAIKDIPAKEVVSDKVDEPVEAIVAPLAETDVVVLPENIVAETPVKEEVIAPVEAVVEQVVIAPEIALGVLPEAEIVVAPIPVVDVASTITQIKTLLETITPVV